MTDSPTPKVSVLMTAYNRAEFISAAIESVLASDFDDFELIIVDDGSKDATVEIARGYEIHDPRVKVYENPENLGDYPNRNRAASLARGEYLKYVDSDDLIYPWGLSILVNCMEQFPEAGYGLCSLKQDDKRVFPFQLSPNEAYIRHYGGQYIFHKAPLSSIIRKSAFRDVNGFSALRMIGDMEMWHKLSGRFPVVLMPHGVVWYREHPAGEMQVTRENRWMQLRYIAKGLEFFKEFCPVRGSFASIVERELKRRQARFIVRALLSDPACIKELRREMNIGFFEIVYYALFR